MSALLLLLACAGLLLALGAMARLVPRQAPLLATGVCMLGVVASMIALLGGVVASISAGLSFGIDGLSGLLLVALFMAGACGLTAPVVLGALALSILAADGVGLVLGLAGAVLALDARTRTHSNERALRLAALVALGAAVALLGGLDPRFAAMRAVAPDGFRAAAILALTLASVSILPLVLPAGLGGLFGIYALARLLLDLSGPVTPVWWGAPVLVLGAVWAILGAREAAAADELGRVAESTSLAAQGVAVIGLGAALLARGADVLPLAALAVAGALLHVLAWSVWGGLLVVCTNALRTTAGSVELARLGGLLRRVPATAIALLAALIGMAALPLSAGFGGTWSVVQALLLTGRLGGLTLALVAAAASAALGFAVAVNVAAAVRLAGVVLLGAPRTAKASAAVEPARRLRLGMAALAGATVLLGLCPGLGMRLAQPGAELLAGADAKGAGFAGLALAASAPGYAAALIAALFVVLVAALSWVGRGKPEPAAPWQGGFIEDGVGRANTWPLRLTLPAAPTWPDRALAVSCLLALVLAAALGWAVR